MSNSTRSRWRVACWTARGIKQFKLDVGTKKQVVSLSFARCILCWNAPQHAKIVVTEPHTPDVVLRGSSGSGVRCFEVRAV